LGQEPELRTHVGNALNLGWKKEEIAEVFMQLVFYGGGPNSLNALKVASEVFEERGL
jgi:4-carboxymuconolactone decarboxylase